MKDIIDSIISKYTKIRMQHNYDPNSSFYNPEINLQQDSFTKLLNHYGGCDSIRIPRPGDKFSIDNVLAIYIILLIEVTKGTILFDRLIKFIFLFREYLNLFGWDYLKNLYDFRILNNINMDGDFCSSNNCEEIPELVEDFIAVFLDIDPSLTPLRKEFIDIAHNLCNWLFINGLTSYKLYKVLKI